MHKYGVRLLKNRLYPVNVPDNIEVQHDQMVIILTEKGEELAKIQRISCCVFKKWGNKLPAALPLVRALTKEDEPTIKDLQEKESQAYLKCNELIEMHKLPMRLVDAKFTYDRKKVTFYFTAQNRVDFRGLLKDLTQTFRKVRIDLRHIGVRDETSMQEGLGICGKEFCCCTWIKQFNSINIKLAKDQGMPISPNKVSGTCGRLLCCLNYEYSTYLEAAVGMPPIGSGVMTKDGIGRVCALHFLNGKVAVKLEDGKIKEYAKKEIEMIDDEVSNIDIDIPASYHPEEETTIDISQLEDDDQSYTSNI